MKKSANMSFRLPEVLKSELSETARIAGMSLTDFNIFLIDSYLRDEDVTQSTDRERSKWQAQTTKMLAELEECKKELRNVQHKYQEQQLETVSYKKIVQESVNKAYQRGFTDGSKQ